MDRLACVDVVALPLQLLLGEHPDWRACPVAVVEDDRPQARVLFVNARARHLGVRTGQRYATALAIAHELHAGAVLRSQLERGVQTIADLLRTFSPHVEPSVETPGVFWLDVSGLGRLYRSCTAWATRVHEGLGREGLQASVVVGFTRFGTYALAISSRGVLCCRHHTDEQTRVERVPLTRLPLDPDVRDRLTALGVASAGDFLRLPADAIRLRFGAETDALFRLASGHSWAPLVPVPADPIFEATPVHFDRAEDNVERLVFLIKRQLDRLMVDVAAHHQAIVGITLRLRLDNRARRTESIRPATATLDTTQLLALIRLRLEAIKLTSGIVTMGVKADTCPADADQHRLFVETRRSTEAANQAFARLRAECGEHSVVRARLCDGHLPTSRFAWEPFTQLPERASPRVMAARPLVRRIHVAPPAVPASASIDVSEKDGESRRHGPYVVSGGWWGDAVKGDEPAFGVHREYYFVHTNDDELWWVYVDYRRQRVFLQGQVE